MQIEPGSPQQSDGEVEDDESVAEVSPELRLVPQNSDICKPQNTFPSHLLSSSHQPTL